mgnify:CR=1 FL=1
MQEQELLLAKTAISLMSEHDVLPVPQNYELFYIYAAGGNPALSRIVGGMIAAGAKFTPQTLRDLRERCLESERAAKTVATVGNSIGETIEGVLGKLEDAGRSAGEYGRTLSEVERGLGAGRAPADARKMIDGLLGATKAMEARTQGLETELHRSSEQICSLKTQLDAVRKESRTDALTGLANRKTFDIEMENAMADWRDGGVQISLLMCDIDHFKIFNDTWGHQTGDRVLRLVAGCLSENVKGRDTAARYGGEEFTVILRHTGIDNAVNLANQIRASVENKKLVKKSTGEILGAVTISIGVAEAAAGDTAETLVQRADMCLYRAKQTGRNRVVGEKDNVRTSAA